MLAFHPIDETAVSFMKPFVYTNPSRFCDFTPVNLFTWAGHFYKAYALKDDMLYLQLSAYDGGTPLFAIPMGDGDRQAALQTLLDYCRESGIPFRLSLVCEEDLPLIEAVCGSSFRATASRDWCDYLYEAKPMALYEGKPYAKQRNHLRRFEKLFPQCRFETLDVSHIGAIGEFLSGFAATRDTLDDFALQEIELTTHALEHMEMLGLFGIVLFDGDQVIGFSAGCRSKDTLFVNFEKADISYDGVYQALVKRFAGQFVTDDIRFINREEDCGVEGLRRSKLAYHPLRLLAKYTLDFGD